MTATAIQHPAGTARPALSGGWVVDLGDAFPTWTPDRDHARDLLDARAASKTTRHLPSGEVPTPGLATCVAARVCEAVTAQTVTAGDYFRTP